MDYVDKKNNPELSKRYLSSKPGITLLLFIVAVVTAQIWFQAILQISRDVLGRNQLSWWQVLILAITFTIILYVLVIHVFKINFLTII